MKPVKNLKFYAEIFTKGGYWVRSVVKTGSLGVRFAEKKGVIIQADDIGQHMGVGLLAYPALGRVLFFFHAGMCSVGLALVNCFSLL